MRLARLLPGPDDLRRRAPKFGGLAVGIALPLLLVGLFAAITTGGLSDRRAPPEPVYIIETAD